MEVETVASREFLETTGKSAGYQTVFEVTLLMIFQVLLQLETLPAMVTLEVAKRQLYRFNLLEVNK